MKKLLFLMVAALMSLAACGHHDYYQDQRITQGELPNGEFMKFIEQHFPGVGIVYIDRDYDDLGITYDFHLDNGVEVEFDKKGEWLEVDCHRMAVPAAIIPSSILTFVEQRYKGSFVVKISRERRNYEVELNNEVELVFDKNGNFKRIDD